MKIKKEILGDVAVLHLSGAMLGGPPTSEIFPAEIKSIIDEGINKVVVDLGKVKRMNSTGLGILIRGYTSLRNNNGDLKLANLNPLMKGVLVTTKLDTIFESYPSIDEAVDSFG
ncbi:STAS domain-containing protein [candidate division KSB1 bacterium]|nr:STAS domain-containing protein [candidate division KSB1 bacterium]